MADIDGVPLEDVQNIDGQPIEEDNDKKPSKGFRGFSAFIVSSSLLNNTVSLKKELHSGMYVCSCM